MTMHVIPDALHAGDLPYGGVATLGNYDGIHRGQRAILETVVRRARDLGSRAVVITFEPHPLAVVRPDAAPARLTTPAQKQALMEEIGIDAMAVIRFDQEFAVTPAEDFVRRFLARELGVSEIYVGSDFAFGRSREGDLALLQRMGAELGFTAEALPEVLYRGERISSTRIRQAVGEGRMEDAMEMLGRPYTIAGRIVKGDRMGQRIGWPTANLDSENELLPAEGVYAGEITFESLSTPFMSAINIGTRPTVYENYRRVVEAHVLDFSSNIYGEPARVTFHKRLREERIFPNMMDLSAQIGRDVESVREYFTARKRYEESTVLDAGS